MFCLTLSARLGAVGAALAASALPACAQGFAAPLGALVPPLGAKNNALTADDMSRMHAAAERLYQGRSIGTVERWRNPDTGNAGSVRLLRRFEGRGMPCWRMQYVIRFERTQADSHPYAINWCRTAGGEWKMLDGAPRS